MHNNSNNNGILGGLPLNINKEIPEVKLEELSITGLIKKSGDVVGYELSNGERISKGQGIEKVKYGKNKGVAIGVSKKGEEYLRSLPDNDESNNLSSLPTVE